VKKGHPEEADRGTFWRGTVIDIDTRLRVGRAIGKDESEVAQELMAQLRRRGHPDAPPAIATDGQGGYREAILETWGQVPPYQGRGRTPIQKQPHRETTGRFDRRKPYGPSEDSQGAQVSHALL